MIMNVYKIIGFLLLPVLLASCKKEDELGNVDNIPGLGGDTWAEGPIDKWIYDSLTVPYNIAVKYKWDQFELALDRTVVPPKESQIIPFLSTVKKVWIETHVIEAGELFMKRLMPKFFNLVGSGSYKDGTVLQGQAEGGRKLVLFQINYFKVKGMPGYVLSDSAVLKEMVETMEHEFAHILHMNVLYPPEFSRINAALITSDWINVSDQEAIAEGFVTPYAMSKVDDDFAETVSIMITLGKPGFDNLVNSINYTGITDRGTTAAVAKARLREKEAIIVNYYKQVWKIDFYNLQIRTRAVLNSLIY
jgi:substrate import-associated zinc metallohydrolase lipoprotein